MQCLVYSSDVQQIESDFRKRLFPRMFPVHAASPALVAGSGWAGTVLSRHGAKQARC